jgi:flagellar protein FlgJ
MENIAQISAYTDVSRFAAMRADARRDSDAAFATVAKEFEALFIQQMLKAARDASIDGGLFNSRELKLYREMLDSQVALAMAEQGGLGFAAVLRDQLDIEPAVEVDRELKIPQAVHFPAPPPTRAVSEDTSDMGSTSSARVAPAPSAQTTNDFVTALRPLAHRAASTLGLAPDILIAQAALETGWGRHTIAHPDGRSSHNLFAIKTGSNWDGDSVDVQTLEYVNDRPMRVNARFRAYPDMQAAFDDYVRFLQQQPRYSAALDHGNDPEKFIAGLARAGYATDPHYAEKILAIKDQIRAQSTIATR